MATIWERAAYSINVCCLFVILVVSHFGIEGATVFLSVKVPGHCLPFTLKTVCV